VQNNWSLLLIIFSAVILLVLSLLVLRTFLIKRQERPKAYGYVTNGKPNGDVELDRFKKPVISSRELENQGNFRFGNARFELVFDDDGINLRIAKDNAAKVTVDAPESTKPVEVTDGKPKGIKAGRKIYVNGTKVASFETAPGRRWS
jgi:hypothetical protein